jgi:hypothetical protein
MIVQISKLGQRLQGKGAGRKHYARLCGILANVQAEEVVFLDFEGVKSVNGSWLNMAVAPLFRWSAETQNDFFPVLSSFPTKDLDELELVAQVNQQCYPVARNANGDVRSLSLVGPLDESLRATFEKLGELGAATGAELARRVPDAAIQATAWNNRLKELYNKRLLQRRKEGRRQVYYRVGKEV